MLKIQKSYDGGYIVYDKRDFQNRHTHTKHWRVAVVIRNNVNKLILPRSRNRKMIESHIRVAKDHNYINDLNKILKEIDYLKSIKRGEKVNGTIN